MKSGGHFGARSQLDVNFCANVCIFNFPNPRHRRLIGRMSGVLNSPPMQSPNLQEAVLEVTYPPLPLPLPNNTRHQHAASLLDHWEAHCFPSFLRLMQGSSGFSFSTPRPPSPRCLVGRDLYGTHRSRAKSGGFQEGSLFGHNPSSRFIGRTHSGSRSARWSCAGWTRGFSRAVVSNAFPSARSNAFPLTGGFARRNAPRAAVARRRLPHAHPRLPADVRRQVGLGAHGPLAKSGHRHGEEER